MVSINYIKQITCIDHNFILEYQTSTKNEISTIITI